MKRISENKGRNQQNKFGKHGGGFPKTAGQDHKTRIRKQRRRYEKTTQNQKQNQKTGKRKSENGCHTKSENRKQKKSLYDPKPSNDKSCPDFAVVLLRPHPGGRGPPLGLATNRPGGEGRPRSFHPSVSNREVKEGRSPFTLLFWPQTAR